jgi:transcription initiation factor TFIID subunit 1
MEEEKVFDPQHLLVNVPVKVIDRETIQQKNKKSSIRINSDEYFKDRHKLSLKDGKFCLFEHIDEHPIFVNNFGMVSKLHRYIYSDSKLPKEDFLPKS